MLTVRSGDPPPPPYSQLYYQIYIFYSFPEDSLPTLWLFELSEEIWDDFSEDLAIKEATIISLKEHFLP